MTQSKAKDGGGISPYGIMYPVGMLKKVASSIASPYLLEGKDLNFMG